MKTLTGPSLLRVSIGVALAGVFTVLAYPIANIFFGKSLNTPWYFAVLFVLSAATIVLALLQVLGRAAELRQDSDEMQTHFKLLEEYDSDFAHRIKSQHQDGPLKVTMDINGTPVTIESTDAGKIEDFVMYITRSIQASNLAGAKALHLRVRENTETYKTDDTSE